MTAKGYEMPRFCEENPHIADMFEEYQMCRSVQLVVVKRSKGSGRDAKEEQVLVYWPTGFDVLPDSGGLNNQDYATVRIFAAMLSGEREGVIRRLQMGG